jgi:5-formyltetrahydrofolate cyclo-ligase
MRAEAVAEDGCDPRLAAAKAEARALALARRAGADPAAGAALAEVVMAEAPPPPGALVGGFWPLGGEIDLRPLLLALAARGHGLALPVTPRRGNPLRFRRWQPGQALQPGPFGTSQPGPEAPEATPDFLLVPLLAFDARGNRLGYGGGYYDRTLAELPQAERLGIAYACQQLAAVPAGATDIRLPLVATERGIVICEGL